MNSNVLHAGIRNLLSTSMKKDMKRLDLVNVGNGKLGKDGLNSL